MNTTPKKCRWSLCLATIAALSLCIATPSALAKKKKDQVEAKQPAPAKDIAKWDSKVDLNGLPHLKVEGVAHYAQGQAFDFSNTVKFAGAAFTIKCQVEATAKSKVCFNAIDQKLETGSGMSCAINSHEGSVSNLPGKPKMNLCAKFEMDGLNKKGYPKGKVKFVAEAGALDRYKTVQVLEKDFH